MKHHVGKKIGLGIIGLFTLIFFAYVIIQYFVLGPSHKVGFVSTKTNVPYHPWIYFLYVHITFGSIALLTGAFQFNKKWRQKNKTRHRTIGKTYVVSVVIAFLAGLYLAYYGTGGVTGVIGFYSLELAWITPTIIGFFKIRNHNIKEHKEWMFRSYAVTLTFVSFRIFVIPVVGITRGNPGMLFGLTLIFSLIFNLLIAELIIINLKKIKLKTNHHLQLDN
ncbi:MAG: DUF2306 domain-containing protein [Bacillota bacterium]|nr:DUF2306 domain-containing protein [Bacillota bacterium]